MLATITQIKSSNTIFMNLIFIYYCCSKIHYWSFATFLKGLLTIFILSYPAFWWQDMNTYLIFSSFTSTPISLLTSDRVSIPSSWLSSQWCIIKQAELIIGYEDECLLGCWAVQSGRSLLMFQRCLLHNHSITDVLTCLVSFSSS
jgi:hypothetical protein